MEYDLVIAEINRRLETMSRSALARELDVNPSTITRVLDRERRLEKQAALEKLGFTTIIVRTDQLAKIRKCIKEKS